MLYVNLKLLLAALLLSGVAACEPDPPPAKGEDPMIEWMKGQINCPKQADHMPKPDPQGMELFEQAQAIEKSLLDVAMMRWHPQIDQAIDLYKQSAARGNPLAMNNLANIYYYGNGVDSDEKESLRWVNQMYAQNTPMGDYTMGLAYAKGLGGLPRDQDKARELYIKAAKRGNPEALYVLANSSLSPETFTTVNRMLQCAIDQGHKEAALALALNHEVMKDYTKSLRATRAGAKLGHPICLENLAMGYERDPTNLMAQGFSWFGLRQDKQRAECLYRLEREVRELPGYGGWRDPEVAFPDLDERCPPNVEQPPGLE